MRLLLNRLPTPAETPTGSRANIHLLGIEISDIESFAKTMIDAIKDTTWIERLDPIAQASYSATSLRTIKALVEIFNKTDSRISSDFGEFMVSISAGKLLTESLHHTAFPISEIWQRKLTGNHGFDYHTECPLSLINFGEAKYNKTQNAYGEAAKQTCEFIDDEKDLADLNDLRNFAGEIAISRILTNSERGFCLAFSVVSDNVETILLNSLQNDYVTKLAKISNSLYLIGVKS